MRRVVIGLAAAGIAAACGSGDGGGPTGTPQTGVLAGQVIDADSSNAGISGVSVQLAGPSGAQTVTTNATGAFNVASAAPGTWQATLQLPAAYDLAANEAGTRSATVTAGQTTTLAVFRMARPTGGLTGTATEAGVAVPGGTVNATRAGFTARNVAPTGTGYAIANLAVGPWSLTYTPPATHRLVTSDAGTRSVSIAEGQTATVSAFLLEPAPPQGEVVEIRLNGTSFLNGVITIAPGTTVRWINEDGQSHTVTPENTQQAGVWTRATTNSTGVVLEHTFTVANQVYRYRCEPHSSSFTAGMVGQITVQ